MVKYAKCFVALWFSLIILLVCAAPSKAQQNPVTAIDIALEPDATMMRHALADNARLLKEFPKGFALDARITRTSPCCSSLSARRTSKRFTLR